MSISAKLIWTYQGNAFGQATEGRYSSLGSLVTGADGKIYAAGSTDQNVGAGNIIIVKFETEISKKYNLDGILYSNNPIVWDLSYGSDKYRDVFVSLEYKNNNKLYLIGNSTYSYYEASYQFIAEYNLGKVCKSHPIECLVR